MTELYLRMLGITAVCIFVTPCYSAGTKSESGAIDPLLSSSAQPMTIPSTVREDSGQEAPQTRTIHISLSEEVYGGAVRNRWWKTGDMYRALSRLAQNNNGTLSVTEKNTTQDHPVTTRFSVSSTMRQMNINVPARHYREAMNELDNVFAEYGLTIRQTQSLNQVKDGVVVCAHDKNLVEQLRTPQSPLRAILADIYTHYNTARLPAAFSHTDAKITFEIVNRPITLGNRSFNIGYKYTVTSEDQAAVDAISQAIAQSVTKALQRISVT